jgi:hypothetical protein
MPPSGIYTRSPNVEWSGIPKALLIYYRFVFVRVWKQSAKLKLMAAEDCEETCADSRKRSFVLKRIECLVQI